MAFCLVAMALLMVCQAVLLCRNFALCVKLEERVDRLETRVTYREVLVSAGRGSKT